MFEENEIGQSMFIIRAGGVAVFKCEFPAPVILGHRGCGETIGEMALLEGENRSASIVALDDLLLLEIQRDNFLQLLRVSPSFSYGIMRLLSARLRETSAAVQRETLDKIRCCLSFTPCASISIYASPNLYKRIGMANPTT